MCNCGIGYGGNKEETVSTNCGWYVHAYTDTLTVCTLISMACLMKISYEEGVNQKYVQSIFYMYVVYVNTVDWVRR